MKLIKITGSFIPGLLLLFTISSCEKTFDEKLAVESSLNNQSIVQVYNAMVNSARNYVYVDGKAVTGALLSSGSVFPASATGIGFNVPGGLRAFTVSDTLRTSTQLPLTFAENLQASKFYTIFTYDTISSPKQKTVLSNIGPVTDTAARLRFANFIYNPTAMTGVDIFSKRQNTNVFTNINISEVTDFIKYPGGLTDTFYVRQTGTGVNLQQYNPTTLTSSDISLIFTPTRGRYYTIVYRGSARGTATTSLTPRTLSVFNNY